jgi:tetratricopeptide (TPR) repeat protein
LLDCRLIADLGRGAQGRVYLGTQPLLADRPVVLKVTARSGQEHLALARLVHSHIVPLHFVREVGERRVRVLCMPYLGGGTLLSLYRGFAAIPAGSRTGAHLVEALDRAGADLPVRLPHTGTARALLGRLSYAEAVCWIGACLADALHHAHGHGLLHLDVKPSNVLLAADGTPMLLDFHLARPPLAAGEPPPDWFGGTDEYMSPEQRRALEAQLMGEPVPDAVDRRSDVWSLGMVLYALLAGRPAGREAWPGRTLRRLNPQVSRGLADVLERAVAEDPAARYPDAATLAEDLRRHLAHRPLRGVPNRSWAERWSKWRRRRPGALARAALAAAAVGALVVLPALAGWALHDWRQQGQEALAQGRDLLAAGRAVESQRVLAGGLARVEGLPGMGGLVLELTGAHRRARRQQVVAELQRITDELRFRSTDATWGAAELRRLEKACWDLWEARDMIRDGSSLADDDAQEGQVRVNLLDLVILGAGLHVRGAADPLKARREALARLDEAESLFGPGPVLDYERLLLRTVPGADAPRPPPGLPPPRTAWEHYARGRTLLRAGRDGEATTALEKAVALDPGGLWPNFYQGLGAYRLGRYDEAVAAFRACIALAPHSAPCYCNRALALEALGRQPAALRDYDRALELDPGLAAAWLNRGLLHFRRKDFGRAAADLQAALEHGADPARVHYDLALVHLGGWNHSAARLHLREALRVDPNHRRARDLLERLR